jgi:hypothetical protein
MKRSLVLPLVATLLAVAPVAYAVQQHAAHQQPHAAVHSPPADLGKATTEAVAEVDEGHAPKPINWTDMSNHEQPPLAFMVLNFVVLLAFITSTARAPSRRG